MSEHPAFQQAVAAIHAGDTAALARLLASHPELAAARAEPDTRGMQNTLLHLVTGMGEVDWSECSGELARLLLDAGAEVDAPESESGGETPLHHAVSVNNVDVARVLLEAGADTERTGRYGGPLDTALGYALFHASDPRLPKFEVNAPELLLRHGASVTLPLAAALGQKDVIETLLELEEQITGDPALCDLTVQQAFVFACHQGRTAVARHLMAEGAQPGQCAPFFHWRCTGMQAAAIQGHRDTVAVLLASGADPLVRDEVHGGTALDWAQMGRDEEVIELIENALGKRESHVTDDGGA